mmetsp:Transcript_1520/g.3242  ORF Transcript_1520/g.3242 Transcript_1520/m.3242 type:complete len:149 (-) Transcript_1520:46-492(-)
METKPLLIINESKPISTQKAHKALKKFLAGAGQVESGSTPSLSTLPDDVLNKLTVLVNELNDTVGEVEISSPIEASYESGKKKRKKESEEGFETEKKQKKDKKDKKQKDKKSRQSLDSVVSSSGLFAENTPAKDSSLMKMKSAINKLK